MPLVYPPLVWLLARCALGRARATAPSRGARRCGRSGCSPRRRCSSPGFRVGLNVRASNVIDVGYSGVIGADRIVHGQSPYGHFPVEDDRAEVRPGRRRRRDARPDPDERPLRDREPARRHVRPGLLPRLHPRLPDLRLERQVGHAARGARDLDPVGPARAARARARRAAASAAPRLAATLAFAWAAWPFTQYASSSNTNDSIMPALLVWGFFVADERLGARGGGRALSGWTKFASLLLVPLWSGYPRARRGRARAASSSLGFAIATALVVLRAAARAVAVACRARLLRPHDRLQVGRDSPFSLWDWRQYHARGMPDLHLVQRGSQVLLVVGALALALLAARAARRCSSPR